MPQSRDEGERGAPTWCDGTMSAFRTGASQNKCVLEWGYGKPKGSSFWVKPPNQLQCDCKLTLTDFVGWIWRIYKERECRAFCFSNVNLVHHPEIHVYLSHYNRRVQINDNHFCTLHNPIMNVFHQADSRATRQLACVLPIIVPVSSSQIISDLTQHFLLFLFFFLKKT